MFIQTETTPNPASLKFLPGREVLVEGSADFRDAQAATVSPLARRLFEIDGVVGVYLGDEFISVTKADGLEWHHLKPAILGTIMEHFMAGLPVLNAGTELENNAASESDSDIVRQIRELIETRVRPAVAQDGGDIIFNRFEEGVVFLTMRGSCSGCPSSTATLKNGIENMLRHYVPEVVEVRQV